MMPYFLAICIDKSLLKAIPQSDGLHPLVNSKRFARCNPDATVVNQNVYYTELDRETILTFEAESKESAHSFIRDKYPNLFIRHIKENLN